MPALLTPSAKPVPPTTPSPAAGSLRNLEFRALGTSCAMQYVAPSDAAAQQYEKAARHWVEKFEARYSRFRPDSLLSRINGFAGKSWVEVDAEMEQMLDICAALHGMTDGMLDATAGPLIRLWDYHRPATVLPNARRVAEVRELVGWAKVQRAPGRVFLPGAGMALDFGGWGKEWAVDAVAQLAG